MASPSATSAQLPSGPGPQTDVSTTARRSSGHYWSGEYVIFLVETEEFRLPIDRFAALSPVFTDFARPTLSGLGTTGTSLDVMEERGPLGERVIRVRDASPADFRVFVDVIYPPSRVHDPRALSSAEWTAILRLATRWEFRSLRKEAVAHLTKLQFAAFIAGSEPRFALPKLVALAEEMKVAEWLLAAYVGAVTGPALPSSADAEMLGVDSFHQLCHTREAYRAKRVFGIQRSGDAGGASMAERMVYEAFKTEIDGLFEKEKRYLPGHEWKEKEGVLKGIKKECPKDMQPQRKENESTRLGATAFASGKDTTPIRERQGSQGSTVLDNPFFKVPAETRYTLTTPTRTSISFGVAAPPPSATLSSPPASPATHIQFGRVSGPQYVLGPGPFGANSTMTPRSSSAFSEFASGSPSILRAVGENGLNDPAKNCFGSKSASISGVELEEGEIETM